MKLSLREKFIAIVDNDRLKKSDAIILLEGDGVNRCKKAADLLLDNWADKLIFSGGINNLDYGSFPFSYILTELKKNGIGSKDVIHEEKSMNTLEQAINIVEMAAKLNWKRIIIVASHYHQYRAFLTFLKQVILSKINLELINAPSSDLLWFEESRWGRRFDLLDSEFDRIKKYSSMGHLATFQEAIEHQKWKESQV
ncbi:MAG: YdcF family protein [Ignavibacteriae bacterium]|nr:YdcF family protein [Ignavibacteriota bacterium]